MDTGPYSAIITQSGLGFKGGILITSLRCRVSFVLYTLVMLLWCVPSDAQVQVETDSVTTDSVDVFAVQTGPKKSVSLAMVADLVLPGLGHYYYGKKTSAYGFFLTDVLSIFGATGCYSYASNLETSAQSYAMTYAGTSGGTGANDYYWQLVGQYMDADGYNDIMDLNRTPQDKILAENLQWRWADEVYRKRYQNYRHSAMNFRVAGNFFIGAMVVNRVLAFIDMRSIGRNNGKGLLSDMRLYPQYQVNSGACGLTLQSSF